MALKAAVLGATGTLGRELLSVLDERQFPLESVAALGSRKTVGVEVSYGDRVLKARDVDDFDWSTVDLCLMAAGDRAARKWAPRIAAAGCIAIDTSAAFRMDEGVPLVVPEVNAAAVDGHTGRRLVVSPDPLATLLAIALKPLHDRAGVVRVVVSTYQSASGGGRPAMDELWSQTKGLFVNQPAEPREYPRQIAFNVIPQVDDFLDDGSTEQEQRLAEESRKILDTDVKLTATCVQTPVFVGHAAAVHVEFARALSAADARSLLRTSPGLMVVDGQEESNAYVTPVECVGEWAAYVSRIRDDRTVEHGLAMWLVADNLRRGSALNAVQIAELLLNRGAFARKILS